MTVRCFILLCCCFCAWFNGLGQSSNVYFSNTVDRFNYSVVRYMVGNLTDQRQEFDNRFRLSGNLYGSDTNFKRIRYAIPPENTRLITLCSQLDSIKINYPESISLTSLPYFLVYSAWSDRVKGYTQTYRYPLLNEFFSYFESTGGKKFTNFQYQLYNKLLNALYHNEKPNSGVSTDTPNDKDGFQKWVVENLKWIVSGISVLLLYLLIALTVIRKRYRYASLQEEYAPRIEKLETELSALHKTLQEYAEISKVLKEKIQVQELNNSVFTEKLGLLNGKLQTMESGVARDKKNTAGTERSHEVAAGKPVPVKAKEDVQVLYFPPPNKLSGRFSDTAGNPAIQSYSVYKFTISSTSRNKAKVELISIPRVTESVLNFPEFYIHHACEAKGDATTAKRISTITPGMAVLEGGEWIIEKPAIIQYE